MWYFHVVLCVAGLLTKQCVVGHVPVRHVATQHQCEAKAADWILALSDVQIGGRQAKVLFKCEKDPADVIPKDALK